MPHQDQLLKTGEIPQEFVNKMMPRLESFARVREFEQRFMPTDHELLTEIRDRLVALENRLSPQPSLLITGDAVAREWEIITRIRK